VIVQAAKQQDLAICMYRPTIVWSSGGDDLLCQQRDKGSRVSVVQGEVHVDTAAKQDVISSRAIKSPPLKHRERSGQGRKFVEPQRRPLQAMLADCGKRSDQRVASPAVRYSTRLLDMTPDNTVFYVAIPNLTQMLTESTRSKKSD